MSHRISRRRLLKGAAAAGTAGLYGFWVGGRGAWADPDAAPTTAPADRVNLGIIGVAGRAKGNLDEEANAVAGQNIVAICDVDQRHLDEAAARFPKAQAYRDFRKLIDRNDIDAVVVSTPDHTHASATLLAIESGKHVYCEKPLAHTVEEVRLVTEAARKHKRVTQMGTQIHAGANYRRTVEQVQSGVIGNVSEVHVYQGSKWAAEATPADNTPVPGYFDYDLWLGPVPFRDYHKDYHPASWRRYWAFGNGTLGDMGCHYIDLPFWALGLKHPTKVSAEGPPVSETGCPAWLTVHWEFPGQGGGPPVKLHWYDAGKKPPRFEQWVEQGIPKKPNSGVLFVGDKGMIWADYNQHELLPKDNFAGVKAPAGTIPNSIGHHREWLAAIRKNDPAATTCRFDYSGPLAETVLLGAVAYRTGKELQWDSKSLKATNAPEADRFIRAEYRKGWGL